MDHPLDLTDEAPATIQTITARLRDRAEAVSGAGPLPGLEPLATEKAGHNHESNETVGQPTGLGPLPGTSTSQVLEISRGSSKKRSPESICYPKLLRENGPSSGRKSHKIVRVEGRFCYGKHSLGSAERLKLRFMFWTQPFPHMTNEADSAHLLHRNGRAIVF